MEEQGLDVAELSETTKIRLGRIFPEWMPVANPVDIWPAIEQHSGTDLDIYSLALQAVLDDQEVDAVLVHAFSGYTRIRLNLDEISSQSRSSGKPVLLWLLGNRDEAFQVQKRRAIVGFLYFMNFLEQFSVFPSCSKERVTVRNLKGSSLYCRMSDGISRMTFPSS